MRVYNAARQLVAQATLASDPLEAAVAVNAVAYHLRDERVQVVAFDGR